MVRRWGGEEQILRTSTLSRRRNMARSCTVAAILSFVQLSLFVAIARGQLHSPAVAPPYHLIPPYITHAQNPVFGTPVLSRGPPQFQNPVPSPILQTNAVSGGRDPTLSQSPTVIGHDPAIYQNPVVLGHDPAVNQNPVGIGHDPAVLEHDPSPNQNPVILEHDPSPNQNPVILEHDPSPNQNPVILEHDPSPNQNPVILEHDPSPNQNPAILEHDPSPNQNPVVIGHDPAINQNANLEGQNPVHNNNPVLTKDYGGHDPVPSSYAPYPPQSPATPAPSPACNLSPPKKLKPSLAGVVVRCETYEEKKCLSLKKVLMNGKCYKLGTPGPCDASEIVVINKKILQEHREVRGTCKPIYSCNKQVFKEFITYDNCCYEVSDIKKNICPSEKNLRLTKNVFGEGECIFVDPENKNSTREIEFQTQGNECLVPDLSFPWSYDLLSDILRFPHLSIRHPLLNVSLHCNEEERACLAKGQVLTPAGAPGALADPAGCHTLLTRGPCPPGAWLVLDKSAVLDERKILPICDWARCAPDSVFLAEDQRCYTLWELQHEHCSSEDIVFDVFGEGHCVKYTKQRNMMLLPQHLKDDECILTQDIAVGGFAGSFARPPCASSDSNRCGATGISNPFKPSNIPG